MQKKTALLCALIFFILSFCCSAYAMDNEGEFNGCIWKLDKDVLTFSGTVVIPVQLDPYESWEVQERFYKKVKEIKVGEGITGLGAWNAFDHYPSITKVIYDVDYFNGMFVMAEKIKEIVYTSSNPYVLAHNFCFSRLDKITFENQDVDYIREGNFLYNRDKTEIFYYFGSKSEKVIIPEGIKIIRSGAFANSKIKSIVFPDTLETIEYCAFIRCSNLTSVSIPASCKQIGPSAFSDCSKLKKIEFEGNQILLTAIYGKEEDVQLAELGNNFGYDKSLTEIVLPSCDIIPQQCFVGCHNLKKVTVGEGTKEIRDNAFEDCGKLETVILPDDIEFGHGAFVNAAKVTIHCHEGSNAEKLAKKYKIKYKTIK